MKIKKETWLILGLVIAIIIIRMFSISGLGEAAIALPIDTIINNGKDLNGKVVVLKGEVVGDIMGRGEHCWLNLYDGSQAVGIYAEREMTRGIKFIGDYKNNGDILEVEGVFYQACPEHGGDLDVHAREIRIIKPGSCRVQPISQPKMYLATSLLFCSLLILWLYIYRKRTQAVS